MRGELLRGGGKRAGKESKGQGSVAGGTRGCPQRDPRRVSNLARVEGGDATTGTAADLQAIRAFHHRDRRKRLRGRRPPPDCTRVVVTRRSATRVDFQTSMSAASSAHAGVGAECMQANCAGSSSMCSWRRRRRAPSTLALDRAERSACAFDLRSRVPSSVVVVVVVVLEVRRVSVDESVAVLVEAIKHPEPAQPTEAVRPRLVERAGLMQGEPPSYVTPGPWPVARDGKGGGMERERAAREKRGRREGRRHTGGTGRDRSCPTLSLGGDPRAASERTGRMRASSILPARERGRERAIMGYVQRGARAERRARTRDPRGEENGGRRGRARRTAHGTGLLPDGAGTTDACTATV